VRPGKPRHTLGTFCISKAHLGRFFLFQGAPWHIKAHIGTSRRTLAHQGAPWVSRVRPGKSMRTLGAFLLPRCTLGDFFSSKAHLGSSRRTLGNFCFPRCTLARQGAPWHVKVHLDAPWHIKVHLGSQGAPWKAKAHLGPILCFQGAPWAHFVFPRCTLAHEGAPWHIKAHLCTSRRTLRGAFCVLLLAY
jgi:hypothetical protein